MGMATPMRDNEEFASFVHAHADSLFTTAYLLTGSPGRAEELLQDTLTRLYPRWARVTAADSPTAYVRRSLVNGYITASRKRSTRDLSLSNLPVNSDGRDLAEEVVDRQLVWQLLRTLPDRQRAALVLRYFHDQPDAEISEALGCRVSTVRSLISRGVAAMRETYAHLNHVTPDRPGRTLS
jgi:RNA polymerase sigma-70 factor (sigma-E family)